MRRREFFGVLGGAVAWPLTSRAQKASTITRVGLLTTGNPRSTPIFQAFEQRLRELGYSEGTNIGFEYRNAEGDATGGRQEVLEPLEPRLGAAIV